MPAYVIVDITATEPVGYEEYKKLAAPTVTMYGGRYIVRGNPVEVLEGDWIPKQLVILEFESVAQAKKLRHATPNSRMIAVKGVQLQ